MTGQFHLFLKAITGLAVATAATTAVAQKAATTAVTQKAAATAVAQKAATTAVARKAVTTALRRVAATTPVARQAATTPIAQEATTAEPAAAQSDSSTQLQGVVVTGSRIAHRDYQSNVPIVTVGADALKQTGEVSMEMALQQLPEFMPDMNADDPLLSNGGRAQVDLYGLGANRTLVLLDGRRMQSSDPTGVIDLNTIPESMIQSVEIITGGASAIYGSDAIAGVVNFKTRDHFQGIEVDGQYGETTRGDAGQEQISVTMGSDLDDGRGNAIISLNFLKRDLVRENSRSFFDDANPQAVLPTGSYSVDPNNLPTQAAVNTAFAQYGVAPGTVLNTRNLGFNDYGNGAPITLFPLTGPIVNYKGPGGPYIIETPTSLTSAAGQYISLVQPLDRYDVYGKLNYNVTNHIQSYTQFYLSQNDVSTTAGPTTLTAQISPNNPFVPAALLPILDSRPDPSAPFTFTQTAGEFGMRSFSYRYTTYQILTGVKGDFDLIGSGWNWDVYGSYGVTTDLFTTSSSTDQNVVDDLTLASDGGASQGCAFNPFGFNNAITQDSKLSAACLKLLEREPKDETDLSQKDVVGELGGPVAKLPAGEVQISATAEFRSYGYVFEPDALEFSELAQGGTNFAVYTNASESVKETSLEVNVPILKDMPAAKVLSVDVAGRYSDYNSTGGTATYKGDFEWAPVAPIRFRGGYEHALRAPNPSELYGAASQVQTTVGSPPNAGDPCDVRSAQRNGPNAAQLAALCVATGVPASLIDSYEFTRTTTGADTEGNPDVKPELANTYTLGAVWSQDFGSLGVRTSVDWYDIQIKQLISTIPLQTVIDSCYNLNGGNPTYNPNNFYCKLTGRNLDDGTISNVLLSNQNVGGLRTKGIDLEADLRYPLPLGALLFNGTLNYAYEWQVQFLPDSPWTNVDGEVVPTVSTLAPLTPKIRGLFKPGYQIGPLQLDARIQYIGSMVDPTFFTNPSKALPGVPAYVYYGLDFSYQFSKMPLTLRGGIDNLANKGPPIVRGTPGVTSPTTYDTVGRRFFVGGTLSF